MIALVCGLATAALWATTLLGSARSARLIGAWSTLGWVMLVGLVASAPVLILAGAPVSVSEFELLHLAVAGVANTAGLLLVYSALRRGKVALVAPIVSTEGAIAATLAILAGDPVTAGAAVLLTIIALGVVLAALERPGNRAVHVAGPQATGASTAATVAFAIGGALLFGITLYATSRIAAELPIAWAILPARLAGVLGVSVPLMVAGRLRITRLAFPIVLIVGVAEVAGAATFVVGARESAAVTSVIASQFAGIAALVAFLFFGERLSRVQVVGLVIIAIGVGGLAALQA